jgi:hypothetical protein
MKKIFYLTLTIIITGLIPLSSAFAKSSVPITSLKIKKKSVKEEEFIPITKKSRPIKNIVFYLKYKVKSWEAKPAALNVYVMRVKKDKKSAYKKEMMLEGKDIEKGLHLKELVKENDDDGKYTKAKHGKVKKIRVELWYPAFGGRLIKSLELPRKKKAKKGKDFAEALKEKDKKKKTKSWWEKVEYGEYY